MSPDEFLFVACRSEDSSAALRVVDELERRGVRCWISSRDAPPAASPDASVASAIEACAAILLLSTEGRDEGEYLRRQLAIAGDSRKAVIPLCVGKTGPRGAPSLRLRDLRFIDAFAARMRMPEARPPAAPLAATSATSPAIATAPTPPRRPRKLLIGAGATLLLVMLAAALTYLAPALIMRSAEAPPQEAASPQPLDLDAIKAAMDACDTTARQDVGAIHFLVIPLAASDGSPRPKPINIVGNGSLLTSHDALDGLADGSLRLYPAKYDFRVRDDATGTLYKWEPWEGVASFSINDSGAVAQFKVQFLTAKSAATDAWGPSYGRPNASCYWISVVIDG